MWLATQPGKMGYLACLGLPTMSQKKIIFFSHKIKAFLIKFEHSVKKLDVGLDIFLGVYGLQFPSWSLNTQKMAMTQP